MWCVRAPVEFVVTRHRITHPNEQPADVARHTGLHLSSVSRALGRLEGENLLTENQHLAHLRTLAEGPRHKELNLHVPNPEQFLEELQHPFLLSGEDAAVHDGYDLIPERHLLYIEPDGWDAVGETVQDVLGKVASRSKANLTVREQDPWLVADESRRFVERGQRSLDYQENKHVQLARSLDQLG